MKMDKGIVIFDGYCNFCSRSVLFIIRRDKKKYFTFAPSQTPEGQNIIDTYRLGKLAQHSIVLIEQGNVYRKSTAALRIARQLANGWRLFYACMIIPKRLRDLIYDLIARSRYRLFGMSDRCFVPEPSIRNRFLQEE
jgi:predicted DCC family thiol-disulfide oxidoreductase YuxK